MLIAEFTHYSEPRREKSSIGDAHTPQPGEIVFDTMRYKRNETVQRSGDFYSNIRYKWRASQLLHLTFYH